MANQEHLDILNMGLEVWNQWRDKNPGIKPDLRDAVLTGTNLSLANFSSTNLSGANLTRADLTNSDLNHANITSTNLSGANLRNADLSHAQIGSTLFVNNDLSTVKGLTYVLHTEPSSIGIDTLYRSQGNIPVDFLKQAGVPDTFLQYIRSLVGHPIEYYTCFISYSSRDQAFAERLYTDLQSRGVRCWLATEDMKVGDKIRPRIDEAIRLYDKLLLVLSEHSIASNWVQREVETAFDKENRQQEPILFPIRLDETVMQTAQAWTANIRLTRHIADFEQWKEHDKYQKALSRLIRDLTIAWATEASEQWESTDEN